MDQGFIEDSSGQPVPICEMEMEWYYGDEDEFTNVASYLSEKYSLVSENTSKLQRAFRN